MKLIKDLFKNGRVALALSAEKHKADDIFDFSIKVVDDKDNNVSEADILIGNNITVVDTLKFSYKLYKEKKENVFTIFSELRVIDYTGGAFIPEIRNTFEVISIPAYNDEDYTITDTGIAQLLFAEYCRTKPDIFNEANISKIFISTPIIVAYKLNKINENLYHTSYDKHSKSYTVLRAGRIGLNLSCTERTWWSVNHGLNVSVENYVINDIVLNPSVAVTTLDDRFDINFLNGNEVVYTVCSSTLEIPIVTAERKNKGWMPLEDIATPTELHANCEYSLFNMANNPNPIDLDLFISIDPSSKKIVVDFSKTGFPIYRVIDENTLFSRNETKLVSFVNTREDELLSVYQNGGCTLRGYNIAPQFVGNYTYFIYSEDIDEELPSVEDVLTIVKQPNPFKIITNRGEM